MKNNLQEQFEKLRNQASQETQAVDNLSQEESSTVNLKQPSISFVVPIELVELPSRGKFYPEGHPLHNKEYVEIKHMTAKEEDILTNKSFIKKGIVIDKLIASLLVDKSIDIASLLVGDKNAIMIESRIHAYGPTYDISVACQSCGSKQIIYVNLFDRVYKDIDSIDEDAKINNELYHVRLPNGNIMIQLPKTGWYVECKMLNGHDEARLLKYLENKKKTKSDYEIQLSEQLALIISSINTETDVNMILSAIDMMPAGDAKYLRNIFQKSTPDVKIVKSFICSSCSAEQDLEVPFTQEFFWPK